jgi:hypothetical protein
LQTTTFATLAATGGFLQIFHTQTATPHQQGTMANTLLFLSAALFGCIHLFRIIDKYPCRSTLLVWTYLLGTATSLWNHGTTSSVAKVVDRFTMVLGFWVDAYLISHIPLSKPYVETSAFALSLRTVCWIGLCTATALYVWTKVITHRQRSRHEPEHPSTTTDSSRPPSQIWRFVPHLFGQAVLTFVHVLLIDFYHNGCP